MSFQARKYIVQRTRIVAALNTEYSIIEATVQRITQVERENLERMGESNGIGFYLFA